MRARALLVATALAAVVPALPSSAATCPLIVDPRGDARPVTAGSATPADNSLGAAATDILSADAWAQNGWLETTLRLAELPQPTAVPRGYGHAWDVLLRAENGVLDLRTVESNGSYEVLAYWDTVEQSSGAATGVGFAGASGTRDLRTGQIRMSLPLAALAAYTKVGQGVRWMPSAVSYVTLGTPRVVTPGRSAIVGSGGAGNASDRADGRRPITVGRRECAR